MAVSLKGLGQLADFVRPENLKQLRKAGAVSPKGPVAALVNLPWLVGRGPSLGILAGMNGFALTDKAALWDRYGTLSWGELNRRVNRAAHAIESLGVRPGESIGLLLRNGREIVELIYAGQRLGVVVCPLNTWAKPKELKAAFETTHPEVLFYDTAHADTTEGCLPGGMKLIAIGDPSGALEDSVPYEELITMQSNGAPGPLTRGTPKPKIIIQTSGTSGTPKGAARDASAAGISSLVNLLRIVPYRRDDVILCPTPLFHSFGLITLTLGTAIGASFVMPDKFDPEDCLRLIDKHRATAASFVPVMIRRILALPEEVRSRYDLSSLRIVVASGSAMSEDMRAGARSVFGDVLYDLYGSTEAGWVSIAGPDDMRYNPSTVGKPVPGIEVAVFDPEGNRVPSGEVGELFVKSKVLFEGYVSRNSPPTRRNEREGHMSIGDLGHFDDNGYLFVDGRADEMVVVGGENVYPVEIENVIGSLDKIDDVAVVGIPDEEYGQVLVAYVVGDAEDADILSACKQELAPYKVPRRIEHLDELPRTTTGKVLKRELIRPDS